MKKIKTKIKSNSERKFDVFRSSKTNQELYIPVVKVDIPKKETVPKSDNVSIATKLRLMKIAGLADGMTILKNIFNGENPSVLPKSIRLFDWFEKEVVANKYT